MQEETSLYPAVDIPYNVPSIPSEQRTDPTQIDTAGLSAHVRGEQTRTESDMSTPTYDILFLCVDRDTHMRAAENLWTVWKLQPPSPTGSNFVAAGLRSGLLLGSTKGCVRPRSTLLLLAWSLFLFSVAVAMPDAYQHAGAMSAVVGCCVPHFNPQVFLQGY